MKELGLYIHIPFCIKRCHYCDFTTFSHFNAKEKVDYIDALLTELKYYAGTDIMPETIYIGGGTPSFIDSEHIGLILNTIRNNFSVKENAEVTIEANPGLLDDKKITDYLSAGINRLSMGVQSMDDELLKVMGRAHNSEDFIKNFNMARKLGFKNISVDLIFAVPGQSMKTWVDTLEKVIDLSPEHISFYALQIEENTPFYDFVVKEIIKPVDEDEDRAMYHRAVNILKEHGYNHYEISNCAKTGFESRHNLKYWSMEDYLGIGLGSHSYIQKRRFSNTTDLKRYIGVSQNIGRIINKTSSVKNKKINTYGSYDTRLNGRSPWALSVAENTINDEMAEYMFTGMRKVEGIYIPDFIKRFGSSPEEIYKEQIDKHCRSGLLSAGSNYLFLTDKGLDLFNQVLADFI